MNIGIYGYGNLGRGVESAARASGDRIVGIFTRRDPHDVRSMTCAPVYSSTVVEQFADKIDAMLICGGSATDLPEMTPTLVRSFNVVDAYDDHARMTEHIARVNTSAKKSGHTALVGCGWDPGLFSLARLYFGAFFSPENVTTYWGRGVSQGHSDAVRRIDGVLDARQYTVPIDEMLDGVRRGGRKADVTELHRREVYVVAAKDADREKITHEIKTMPDYFAGYETNVIFITAEEMRMNHGRLSHGGGVIATSVSKTAHGNKSCAELGLSLDSNPEFTGKIMLTYARAAYRLSVRGEYGCRTVFDIAARDLNDDMSVL